MFWAIGVLAVGILVVVHVAAELLLLTFAGLLFGTALRGAAEWCSRHAKIGIRTSLVVCIGMLVALGTSAMLWIVPHATQQAGQLWSDLARSVADLEARLAATQVGRALSPGSGEIAAWVEHHAAFTGNFLIGIVGALGAVIYVIFVALYFAASPRTYRCGVLALVPPSHGVRAGQVLDQLGRVLQRWLWARLISMTALGITSAIGLWLLGIPLALSLGLLAGALLFVPYLGSIASAIPALLIAITVDPMHVLYVGLLYIGIHLADGYLLSPPLQRRAVDVPPLLLLASQLAAGALWGILGFTFATPLVASLMIAVRMLYVEGLLGSPGEGGYPPAATSA